MEYITFSELFRSLFIFIKRYFLLALAMSVLGFFAGKFFAKTKKPYYQASYYVSTGLIFNDREYENNLSLLLSDLKTLENRVSNTNWVKENFNLDTSSFIQFTANVAQEIKVRNKASICITLETYDPADFERFKKGLLYYYKYKSPLIPLYNQQIAVLDKITVEKLLNIAQQTPKSTLINLMQLYDLYMYKYKFNFPLLFFTSNYSQPEYIDKTTKYITFSVIAFFFVGYLIGLILELYKLAFKTNIKTDE